MSMNRNTVIVLALVLIFAVIPAIIAMTIGVTLLLSRGACGHFGRGKVGLIHIEGLITADAGSAGLLSEASAGSEQIIAALEEFRKDDGVKSLVLRINSPGGSAAGSQEVYQEIQKVRRSGKKITVSMGDVAASGGYYIASAADRIMADQATMTGSIGVIMHTSDMHELFDKIGIKFDTIKTGPYKDMGSTSRPMTPAEKQLLQNLVDDVYQQFITDVSVGRGIPVAQVRRLADGRVFTGRQAAKYKLVDQIGSMQDALNAAAKDAGIKGEYEVVEYDGNRGFWSVLLGESSTGISGWLRERGLLGRIAHDALGCPTGLQAR